MKNTTILAFAMAALGLPCSVYAQEAAPAAPYAAPTTAAVTPKPGDPVFDKTGAKLGAVASVTGNNVVLTTDKGNALIPTTSLAMNANGLTLNMLKSDVEAEIQAAKTTPPKS